MIDIAKEQMITLNAAAGLVPCRRAGRKCHVATVYRWTQHGVRGRRLETIQVGGTRCTSREALQRFFEALSGGTHSQAKLPVEPPTNSRVLAEIDKQLDAEGL